MDDDSPKAHWERRTEAPLAVASLMFLASYAVRWRPSGQRLRFVRTHWLDTLVLLLRLLRPLRA